MKPFEESKKKKFFEVLKNIFIGAQIEGDSGYVNLMRIKSKYYNEFKSQLNKDINSKLKEVGNNFEEELYNKLYTFFNKYFSESGSIYFSYTPLQEKVYERVYRDDKDVMLFWKTNMLYYVKTERLFKDMEVFESETKIKFFFDVSQLELKKNNEKKELVFELKDAVYELNKEKQIHFYVKYSKNGSKTKIDDTLKELKKVGNFKYILNEKIIERVFSIFRKQSEVDFFINKNAKEFLREQFLIYIKNYLVDDETIFEEKRLKQMKAIKDVAFYIIELVSQFEDELVKIWNKPKFSYASNYVITLDKIAEKNFHFIEKIIKHNKIKEQIEEWKQLGLADENFNINQIFEDTLEGKKIAKKWHFLPIDTKYFKDIELDILSLFDDLDNQLDGWLIHSENYQALNTIKNKFREKVQLTYIDPPFNLESSDQFDYRTNYKDSSWLSLLENRLNINKVLLNDKGSFFGRCDYNGNYLLRQILDNILEENNFKNEIIVSKSAKITEELQKYHNDHDTVFLYSRNGKFKFSAVKNKRKEIGWQTMHLPGVRWSPINEETAKLYSPKNVKYEQGKYKSIARIILGKEYLPPKGRHWALSQETIFLREKEGKIRISENGQPESLQAPDMRLTDNWTDIPGYSSTQGFPTENAEKLLDRVINTGTDEKDLVLDYFMGSATTQAVAQKLKRRWLGVEMGEHFFNVDVPRLKRVVAGIKEGISKEVKDYEGGGFFKYFSLEQYEEVLRKVKYEDKTEIPTKSIYSQYLFLKDIKLADEVIKLDEESESIKVDLTKLHKDIDIPETLSHLLGKFISRIKKDEVVFTDGTSIDLNNIDYKIIKPLIWW